MRVVYDLVAFGFIIPIKNAKGKKNANFRSRIQTLGKQILASVNFAPNRIGPSNIATTLEFVKKISISNKPGTYPTDKLVNI